MMRRGESSVNPLSIFPLVILLTAFVISGCSGGAKSNEPKELVEVGGTVKMDGAPLADANIFFEPMDAEGGTGGYGRTDAEGKFTVTYRSERPGLPPASYRVVVSKRILPNGSPAPLAVTPLNSVEGAQETLARTYSDVEATMLTATVEKVSKPLEFTLSSR